MKRIVIIIFLMIFASISQAQNVDKIKELPQRLEEINKQISDFNNYIESIRNVTDSLYNVIQSNGGGDIENKIQEVNNEIITIENSIEAIQNYNKWIDDLRVYYTNSPVDMLFAQSDTLSLRVHKQILGQNYPKRMDDLIKMHECANLLNQEFNKSYVGDAVQTIKGVINCSTKWKIKKLLDNYATISDEVDKWIATEEPTLYNMMAFRKKLNENYNINIDDDYPYLAAKIRQKVTTK